MRSVLKVSMLSGKAEEELGTASPQCCSATVVTNSWESTESSVSKSRGRLLVEALFRLEGREMTELEMWRELDEQGFGRGETMVLVSHMRRHGALVAVEKARSEEGDVSKREEVSAEDDESSKTTKVAMARSLTSLSGSVPEEAKKLAEQCKFDEIEKGWDAQTAKAAMTWVWNISQTLPFGEQLFSLAREGRFEEVDNRCSEAAAFTLRAWCMLKCDEWKKKRAERARTMDDRQARTVAQALYQLYPDTIENLENPDEWILEVADGSDDIQLDDTQPMRIEARRLEVYDVAPKIDRAVKRRTETCVRKFLTKHGLVGTPMEDVAVVSAASNGNNHGDGNNNGGPHSSLGNGHYSSSNHHNGRTSRERSPEDDEADDDDDDSHLREMTDAEPRIAISRQIPTKQNVLATLPGRPASHYVSRARRARPTSKKRVNASGRAPQISVSRRKPPVCSFEPIPYKSFRAESTTSVPWSHIANQVQQGISQHIDYSPMVGAPSPRRQRHNLPYVPKLELTPSVCYVPDNSKRQLPAPAVTKLDTAYGDDSDDSDDSEGSVESLDPDVMLRSHEIVLATMKKRLDKLVQDAKLASPRPHKTYRTS